MTNTLLNAHGIHNETRNSPLEAEWKCLGAPEAPRIAAEDCNNTNFRRATVAGGKDPNQPLAGLVLLW